jgi:hypothetical protein
VTTDEDFYRQQFVEPSRQSDLCTPKQAAMLARHGVPNADKVLFKDVDRVLKEARIANIKPPPTQGQGVHKWMIYAARVMHENSLPADEITRRIDAATAHMKRPNRRSEIAKTVRKITNTTAPIPGAEGGGAWPDSEHERIDSIVTAGPGLYDVWESSPRPIR